jgi:N-acetyl-alpha-D-glucosaminyl L-malate synthase BshA
VATELGLALARTGEFEIHFITHAPPHRLRHFEPNVFFHEVETASYPPFPHAPYSLALASKMTEVARYHGLDLLHVHYAIPHAASAWLAQQMLGDDAIGVLTTLHGTDITLVGQDPSLYPLTRFVIERSDSVSAVSDFLRAETQRVFEVDRPIEVIGNFVDTSVFVPRPDLRAANPPGPARRKPSGRPGNPPVDPREQLPPGEERASGGGGLRTSAGSKGLSARSRRRRPRGESRAATRA